MHPFIFSPSRAAVEARVLQEDQRAWDAATEAFRLGDGEDWERLERAIAAYIAAQADPASGFTEGEVEAVLLILNKVDLVVTATGNVVEHPALASVQDKLQRSAEARR